MRSLAQDRPRISSIRDTDTYAEGSNMTDSERHRAVNELLSSPTIGIVGPAAACSSDVGARSAARFARRAGRQDASAAMVPSSTTTIVYVGTSYGLTPKSSAPSERRSSSEPAMPIAAPMATSARPPATTDAVMRAKRAKGDADADVLRPFSNEIDEQTVESERRQQQAPDGEARRDERDDASGRKWTLAADRVLRGRSERTSR